MPGASFPERTVNGKAACFEVCIENLNCVKKCNFLPRFNFVSVSPPPHHDIDHHLHRKILLLLTITITASIILGVFLLCVLCKKLNECHNSRRGRRNRPIVFDTEENFAGDDEEPVLDHHIWHINRVGLQQSVIDSITMFTFKKHEKLVDGTECSVCLAEFQDDESLRLLPKCSHAFHILCIDTWLRSHKNCPLCRAPILSNSAASESISTESGSRESPQMETAEEENRIFPENNQGHEDRRDSEIAIKELSRTSSDLAENCHVGEEEVQPTRRSVSFDSLSASAIYKATNNIQISDEASSSRELLQVKNSITGNVPKVGIGNQSKHDGVQSTSFRRSVEKGSISMSRFNSSGRKLFSFRHCKSQSSVLPL